MKDRADQIKVAEERRMKSAITEKPSKFQIVDAVVPMKT